MSAEKPAQPAAKKVYPPKVSFYQDAENTARMRGAIFATRHEEGYRGLSDFIDSVLMAEVERLEAKYNDGQPFPPVKADRGHAGRQIG